MLCPLQNTQADFSINDTSWMMNKVRSDTVVTCIGSRVQENVLQFGQNHQKTSYFGYIFGPLTPLSASNCLKYIATCPFQ